MSQTPTSSSRLSVMNPSLNLRLTPSTSTNSPFTPNRPSPLRSPTKSYKNELGISLKQVIGSTASARNAFDSSGSCFAYTAGAAAVVATYNTESRKVEQRFFRAKPTTLPMNPSPVVYDHGTPTQTSDLRSRTGPLRHAPQLNSPFSTPGRDWTDGSTGKSWSAKERVKAASCVSLSPNGLFLAVGEVGYNPRVIIFAATEHGSPDVPLTSLTDHTFGVNCVAFSPDSRYLASLGAANDGFLYIWRINERTGAATLAASNKCTSNITQMIWMGNKLVTIGTRHVKVWRVEDSNPGTPAKVEESTGSLANIDNRTLSGRNCVLGDLLEATYTTAAALTTDCAVVGSDKGWICLLRDTDGQITFTQIAALKTAVRAILPLFPSRLLIASVDGRVVNLDVSPFEVRPFERSSGATTPELLKSQAMPECAQVEASAFIELNGLIGTLSNAGAISLLQTQDSSLELAEIYKLPAHGDSVMGVRAFSVTTAASSFFTWATDGSIMLWSHDGSCMKQLQVAVEQHGLTTDGTSNELRVARHLPSKNLFVTGDKLGVLKLCTDDSGNEVYSVRAHSAEITDIAIYDGDVRYIASAGRDRVIQVFHDVEGRWELLHTLDEHVGAVTGVAFSKNGEQLISSSSDRTVVVRDRASRQLDGGSQHAFIISRTITLKSTPMAMTFDAIQDNVLYLSTIDRFIHYYDAKTGKLLGSFKSGDAEGGDNVVMSALVAIPTVVGGTVLAGLSSTDKSIRLYDESGVLLARDWGHTEGVTDIAMLIRSEADPEAAGYACLVTVALDGTIFTWQADLRPPKRYDPLAKSLELMDASSLGSPGTEANPLLSRPPLRRVLSQSEVASFRMNANTDSEDTPTRPSAQRSPPRVRRRVSRMNVLSTPKLEPSPATVRGRTEGRRKSVINRSPSPPSPKLSAATLKRRKSAYPDTSGHAISRTKSAGNLRETASSTVPPIPPLTRDTDSTCRNLRIYRKKLTSSTEVIPPEVLREVQKELSLTLRAVGEKAMRPRASQVDEETLGRVLDQYSTKLVEMLDTRLASLALGTSTSGSAMSASNEFLAMGSNILDSPIEEQAEHQSPPQPTRHGSI